MSKSSLKLTKYTSEIKHDLLNNELNNILCLQIFYMNKNSVLPVNKKFNFKVWWLLGWWNIILTHQQLHAASGWLGLSFFYFSFFFSFVCFSKKKLSLWTPPTDPVYRDGDASPNVTLKYSIQLPLGSIQAEPI